MASQAILTPAMSSAAAGCASQMPPPLFHEALAAPIHQPRLGRCGCAGWMQKLQSPEVYTPIRLSTGRRDQVCHIHGKMEAWKKSCENLRG